MARLLRIDVARGWYHVITRGIERGRIFRDAHDCQHFVELLSSLPKHLEVELHAFVLMHNHYRLPSAY